MAPGGFPGKVPLELHPEKDECKFTRRQRDWPYEMCTEV